MTTAPGRPPSSRLRVSGFSRGVPGSIAEGGPPTGELTPHFGEVRCTSVTLQPHRSAGNLTEVAEPRGERHRGAAYLTEVQATSAKSRSPREEGRRGAAYLAEVQEGSPKSGRTAKGSAPHWEAAGNHRA